MGGCLGLLPLECRKCWNNWSKHTAHTTARTKSMKPNQSKNAHLDGRLSLLPLAEAHKSVAARAAGGVVPPAQKARAASAACAQGACCAARARVSASVQGGRQLRYWWAPKLLGLCAESNAHRTQHSSCCSHDAGIGAAGAGGEGGVQHGVGDVCSSSRGACSVRAHWRLRN